MDQNGQQQEQSPRERVAPVMPPSVAEVIEAFFDAENVRDWPRYAAHLHPAVEWTVFDGSAGRTVAGRSAYVEAMKHAYEGAATQFRCIQALVDESRGRVATWLIDDEGNRSLDVFDLQDGLIKKEWEYLFGAAGLKADDGGGLASPR